MKKILRKSGRFGIFWVKLSVNGHLDPGDLILKVVLNNQYCYNLTALRPKKRQKIKKSNNYLEGSDRLRKSLLNQLVQAKREAQKEFGQPIISS